MDTFLIWTLKFLGGLLCLGPFLEMFPIVVLLYALRRVRIDASRQDEIHLVGVDPWTMLFFVISGSALSIALFMSSGFLVAAAGASISLLLALGCRIELSVTQAGSRFTRRIFGFVPWSVWHSERPPELFIDGWGDMDDPEALHIGFGLGSLELGWGDSTSGDFAAQLVDDFANAVRALGALYSLSHR